MTQPREGRRKEEKRVKNSSEEEDRKAMGKHEKRDMSREAKNQRGKMT